MNAKQRHALELGHKGARRAAKAAGEQWQRAAYHAVLNYAKRYRYFTTEAVRTSKWGAKVPKAREPRAWGAVALAACADGITSKVGMVRAENPRIHGMHVTLWRSNI